MHSFVTSKNVKWCHLIWPTLYMILCFSSVSLDSTINDDDDLVSDSCFAGSDDKSWHKGAIAAAAAVGFSG